MAEPEDESVEVGIGMMPVPVPVYNEEGSVSVTEYSEVDSGVAFSDAEACVLVPVPLRIVERPTT